MAAAVKAVKVAERAPVMAVVAEAVGEATVVAVATAMAQTSSRNKRCRTELQRCCKSYARHCQSRCYTFCSFPASIARPRWSSSHTPPERMLRPHHNVQSTRQASRVGQSMTTRGLGHRPSLAPSWDTIHLVRLRDTVGPPTEGTAQPAQAGRSRWSGSWLQALSRRPDRQS